MIEFYFMMLIPLVIQHTKVKGINYEKKNQCALGIFFVILTIMLMLRHPSVGTDTENYRYFFQEYAQCNWNELSGKYTEFGFAYFNKIVSLLANDPQVFIAISSVIICVCIYPTYKRLCVDTSLTVTIFCIMSTFVMMFSGIRQMIAIGMGIRAYEFMRQKKLAQYVLTILLAMTFHTSAFMLFLLYPMYTFKGSKRKLYIIIPIMCLLFLFNRQIFAILTGILAQYTRFDTESGGTGAYAMLVLFAIFAIFSYIIPDENTLSEEVCGLRNILLLTIVIQMFAPLHTLAMRMNYYFIIYIPLLIPKIIEAKKKRYDRVAVFARHIMLIFFMFYFYMMLMPTKALHVFPYHFFWENIL